MNVVTLLKALVVVFLMAAFTATPASAEFLWKTASADSQGVSLPLLDALGHSLAARGTTSFLVVRHDRIVYEWYGRGSDKNTLNDIGSLARSFVGGVSLAVALIEGRLSLDDPVSKYVPQWRRAPDKSRITIRQLATGSSGLDDAVQTGASLDQLAGWKRAFWRQATPPDDPFTLSRDLAPTISPPGPGQAQPSHTEMAMLAYAITASLKGTSAADIRTFLRSRIMSRIGISNEEWSIGYGKTFQVDGLRLVPAWGGAFFTTRAMARVGRLMLYQGSWQGQQLISRTWVGTINSNGLGWTNEDGSWGSAPKDAFGGAGDLHQILMVVPSLDLIVVRTGTALDPSIAADFRESLQTYLINPLMEAVVDQPDKVPEVGIPSRQTIRPPIMALTSSLQTTAASSANLWIPANSGTLSGQMAMSTTYAAGSLGGALVYPSLNTYNTSNTAQADAATYRLTIPVSGTWYLWARMYYPGTTAQPINDPNSFWAAMDGGSAKVLGNLTTKDKTSHWEGAAGSLLSFGTVSAGSHTLKIWNREARETSTTKLSPRLDVLLLTNDSTYVPNDPDAEVGLSQVKTVGPYPPSPVIQSITWAPGSSIVRKATGGDCWPITGGDDGNLYAAYGDGNGFDPKLSVKLSLGFAKVAGLATGFSGVNIRSSSGEQKGDGKIGKKSSGMLMVNGTLYMWARNADLNGAQSQLAWSSDHAATWTWSGWKFAEFGYLTFLNFGDNYSGARDGYVYAYSHDNPSAYTAASRMILLRVPQNQITSRNAYQFFKSLDAGGNPVWTSAVSQRGAVFTHAQRCLRSGISYNAALKRYFWWQQIPNGVNDPDTRFSGGFGLYDAPAPWGPWTTVYFTNNWDVGPGETASFPTKWISKDGKTLYLVFSGNDAFSVRKATLTLR
jgi:CubicO group peptidase (beta-lactamase class C family)